MKAKENDRKSINFYSYVYNWVCRSSIDGGIMSKVLWLCVYDEMKGQHCESCIEKAMRFEELNFGDWESEYYEKQDKKIPGITDINDYDYKNDLPF